MTDDPLTRYAALMNRANAPRELSRAVLDRIESQQSEQTRPTGATGSAAPRHQAGPAPTPFSVKRHRFRGFAVAACLLLLAVLVGLSLAVPRFAKNAGPLGFAINAYGASGNSLLAMGEDGRILFEADILFRVPPDDRYAEEGVYTGCMFRIEGDDIVRVQAHIDKGELYRYTYDEFQAASNPDRWAEAQQWSTASIGEGAFFGAYDLVQPVSSLSESEQPDNQTVGVKCYQRLGSTVDLPVNDEIGSRLSDYCFGLWTNEDAGAVTGYQDYIDTLDTVTIEKADGSHATKSIELTAADVKAKLVPSETNGTPALELIPQIVDPFEGDVQERLNKRSEGYTWIHTLYGTVAEENCEPFPFEGEQLQSLDRPLTEPASQPAVEPASAEPDEAVTPQDTWVVCKNPLRLGEAIDVRPRRLQQVLQSERWIHPRREWRAERRIRVRGHRHHGAQHVGQDAVRRRNARLVRHRQEDGRRAVLRPKRAFLAAVDKRHRTSDRQLEREPVLRADPARRDEDVHGAARRRRQRPRRPHVLVPLPQHLLRRSHHGNVPHRRFDPSLGRSAAQPPLPCAELSFLPVLGHRRSLRGFEAARTPPAKRIRSNELFRLPQNNLTL